MKTTYLLLILFFGCTSIGMAQHSERHKDKSNFKKHPYWIQMMDDPNVNYFEAVEAFEAFWKGRPEPDELEEEYDAEREHRVESDEEKAWRNESYNYVVAFKRFKQWKRDAEPYVQSDGSILSKEAQMEIWKNSRK